MDTKNDILISSKRAGAERAMIKGFMGAERG